ncbi:TIF1A-like protein [Mya arenaria]|uniref:TIF1A-like protein n=1 Tax=Mya arenaria TaxID=6604 RepID=A0ABY7EWM4_MYAAR|nr:TIF1A-like protein [Mya arenaria]
MEVSGRRANTDVAAGSAKATPLCEPCRAEGKEQEAHGFCNNCNVYICPSCIKVHEILTVTKYHNVLGKQKMPIHYPSSQKAADVSGLDLCQDHPSEVSKFYCPEHEQFGCWDCIVLNHRTCKIDYIPKVAHSFTASSEFKVLVDKVAKLEADLNTWKRKLQSDKQSVLDLNQVQLKRLEEFRVEINEYLDKQEKALVEAMDKARKKDTDRIQRWREDIDAAKLTLAETKSRLEAQDKNANHIYVTARHAQQILGDMQTLIKKVETENMVTRYKFSRDKKTEDLLMWEDVIGKMSLQGEVLQKKSYEELVDLGGLADVGGGQPNNATILY